jgi:hypothetical protein
MFSRIPLDVFPYPQQNSHPRLNTTDLDNRFPDGGVSPTRRFPFTPGRFPVLISVIGRVNPRALCSRKD